MVLGTGIQLRVHIEKGCIRASIVGAGCYRAELDIQSQVGDGGAAQRCGG